MHPQILCFYEQVKEETKNCAGAHSELFNVLTHNLQRAAVKKEHFLSDQVHALLQHRKVYIQPSNLQEIVCCILIPDLAEIVQGA